MLQVYSPQTLSSASTAATLCMAWRIPENILFKIPNPSYGCRIKHAYCNHLLWSGLCMIEHKAIYHYMVVKSASGTLAIQGEVYYPRRDGFIHLGANLDIQQHQKAWNKHVSIHIELKGPMWVWTSVFDTPDQTISKLKTKMYENNWHMEDTVGFHSSEPAQLVEFWVKGKHFLLARIWACALIFLNMNVIFTHCMKLFVASKIIASKIVHVYTSQLNYSNKHSSLILRLFIRDPHTLVSAQSVSPSSLISLFTRLFFSFHGTWKGRRREAEK